MRAAREDSIQISEGPDAAFQATLGVFQANKGAQILAVHNEGRKLVVRERAKFSNPKIVLVWVTEEDGATRLNIVVGTDPRSPKAVLDGRANDRSMKIFQERVQGALDGSAPAPAEPVSNHYMQKKTEVPWDDPDQEPDIELGGGLKAAYAF